MLVLATSVDWHYDLFKRLKIGMPGDWHLVTSHEALLEFTEENKTAIERIYLPHWSFILPKKIYASFECIVFHMTDLPYGRGGSPLQNLILRGHKTTKISALNVVRELDAGPVYLKKELDLSGSASEIFIRASHIIGDMILEIEKESLEPQAQIGEVVEFRRRKPSESEINFDASQEELYDFIRMLDADGYPHAYANLGRWRMEFSSAENDEASILVRVKLIRNPDHSKVGEKK